MTALPLPIIRPVYQIWHDEIGNREEIFLHSPPIPSYSVVDAMHAWCDATAKVGECLLLRGEWDAQNFWPDPGNQWRIAWVGVTSCRFLCRFALFLCASPACWSIHEVGAVIVGQIANKLYQETPPSLPRPLPLASSAGEMW